MTWRSLHAVGACLLLFAFSACGRDVAEAIHSNSQELRGLRQALHNLPAAGAAPITVAREQITSALQPLASVLKELQGNQQQLASQQSQLAAEMGRWTRLIAQTVTDAQAAADPTAANEAAAQAKQLQERLAAMEQTMRAQDERHREVEALMQRALDHTADQLETFLNRLQTLQPPDGAANRAAADEAAPTRDVSNGNEASQPPPTGTTPAGGGGRPDGAANAPGGGHDLPDDEQRGGVDRWIWWVPIVLAVLVGTWLLVDARWRGNAAAVASITDLPDDHHEQLAGVAEVLAPTPADSSLQRAEADEPVLASEAHLEASRPPAFATEAVEPLAPEARQPETHEVEELWAAAALLGEAIGKLKHGATPEATALTEAGSVTAEPTAGDRTASSNTAPAHGSNHEADLHDLGPGVRPIELAPIEPDSAKPVAAHRASPSTASRPLVAATSQRPPLQRPAPIDCRIRVEDRLAAEARVRELLNTDPRVLIAPAPQVQHDEGELRVTFAMLPGVPDGERSQFEQRLRDCVA